MSQQYGIIFVFLQSEKITLYKKELMFYDIGRIVWKDEIHVLEMKKATDELNIDGYWG